MSNGNTALKIILSFLYIVNKLKSFERGQGENFFALAVSEFMSVTDKDSRDKSFLLEK